MLDRFFSFEQFHDFLVPRNHLDFEWHWRSTGKSIVFVQVNRLSWDALHSESPEHSGDRQEDLPFSEPHPWANASTSKWIVNEFLTEIISLSLLTLRQKSSDHAP